MLPLTNIYIYIYYSIQAAMAASKFSPGFLIVAKRREAGKLAQAA